MLIDTLHQKNGTVVKIKMQSYGERQLTDKEWIRVACNQHKLRWGNCSSGIAELPATPIYGRFTAGATVLRDGDRISITLPLS